MKLKKLSDDKTILQILETKSPKECMEELGFYVWRQALNVEVLSELKKLALVHAELSGIRKHDGVRQPHSFRKAPFIIKLFEDDKIKELMNTYFGHQDWFITNHADLHTGALGNWHKDDGMSYGNGGYFEEPAYHVKNPGVFKIAAYFQDHNQFFDGLTIIPSSHRTEKIKEGEQLYIDTRKGDLLFFDPRLSHTGQRYGFPDAISSSAKRKIKNNKVPPDIIGKDLKTPDRMDAIEKFQKINGVRSTLFFTVAEHGHYSEIFAINNMRRQLQELEDGCSPYLCATQIEQLSSMGIKTIDNEDFFKKVFS
jgi:hypothetical protein